MKQLIQPFDYAKEFSQTLGRGILLNTQDEKFNSMVIGWGHLGIIWGIPTYTVYVRQSRYTKALLDKTGVFTISAPLGAPDREINRILGTLSGRDVDKAAMAGLRLTEPVENGVPGIAQYPLTLECRVLYRQDQVLAQIPDAIRSRYYNPQGPDAENFHTAYIGQITAAYLEA